MKMDEARRRTLLPITSRVPPPPLSLSLPPSLSGGSHRGTFQPEEHLGSRVLRLVFSEFEKTANKTGRSPFS